MADTPRYGTNTTNTSKWMTDLINEFNKMPRGVFNNSRIKSLDVPLYGIIPLEVWEMLPNSEAILQYNISAITKNPTVKKLMSSMNIELRTYRINYNDCHEGWNNFVTKGRSGKLSLQMPYVDWSLGTNSKITSLPYNPAHYLNLAPAVFLAQDTNGDKFKFSTNTGIKDVTSDNLQSSLLTGITGSSAHAITKSSTALRISALPFVFYNKIAKLYQTANLLQDNTNWYPENEAHDNILPYSAQGSVTTSSYDYPTHAFGSGDQEQPDNTTDSYPWLNVLWFAQRKGDMFNTGSPFPELLRGDIPTIQTVSSKIDWSEVVKSSTNLMPGIIGVDTINKTLGMLSGGTGNNIYKQSFSNNVNLYQNGTVAPPSSFNLDKDMLLDVLDKATIDRISLSMSNWRYLATMTVMRERLALTDGSYNMMVKAMFGHNPNWHNHEPIYCGGHKQPIVFSEVVNQSENNIAPLGSTAGRAYSDTSSTTIRVRSDDFGMFMTVIVVTPDEYYSQGVDKMFSRLQNAEQYFPILNNLSADATLNKELYVSGSNNTDEDVFNYVERFAYYKSRRNQVSGLLSLPISLIGDTGAYIQNRLFGSTPQFNQAFSRGELTSNEKAIFTSTDQAPFVLSVGCSMRYIAPIPEDSRPSDMGISY